MSAAEFAIVASARLFLSEIGMLVVEKIQDFILAVPKLIPYLHMHVSKQHVFGTAHLRGR